MYLNAGTLRRYVHGPDPDEVLVWYEGSGTGDRRYLHADAQGSTVAISDGNGNALAIDRYDEYGIPAPTNLGRFQYTGQAWLAEIGLYHYKARIYSPTWGRFLQTDPVGYQDQFNLYAYVGNDPTNATDPKGTQCMGCHSGRTPTATPTIPRLPVLQGPSIQTVVNVGLCVFTGGMCGPLAGQILHNEGEEDFDHNPGPYGTSAEDGRIHENDLDRPIDDADLDDAIRQLDHSIDVRERENSREPRGNPGGTPRERAQNATWRGHQERIQRETQKMHDLESRARVRDRDRDLGL